MLATVSEAEEVHHESMHHESMSNHAGRLDLRPDQLMAPVAATRAGT